MKGTNISALYAKIAVMPSIQPGTPLSVVGFSCIGREPSDEEVYKLVDDAITQVLGPRGLSEIIKPGDRVVVKLNLVGPHLVAEKVRKIIVSMVLPI